MSWGRECISFYFIHSFFCYSLYKRIIFWFHIYTYHILPLATKTCTIIVKLAPKRDILYESNVDPFPLYFFFLTKKNQGVNWHRILVINYHAHTSVMIALMTFNCASQKLFCDTCNWNYMKLRHSTICTLYSPTLKYI